MYFCLFLALAFLRKDCVEQWSIHSCSIHFKSSSQLCMSLNYLSAHMSTLLFFSEATGLIAFFVKCIGNSIQVYCDSSVIKCLTESIWPRGSNHWSYGHLPSPFFLALCLQLGLFIIIYIFSICLICGYALLSLYVIFLM